MIELVESSTFLKMSAESMTLPRKMAKWETIDDGNSSPEALGHFFARSKNSSSTMMSLSGSCTRLT